MPDGYDWLGRASWPTETHMRWVILTGAATVTGQETDAFRLPDELESRLIDVTISINPAPSGVYEMPPSRYHDILHEPDLQAEGTCRWTSPHDNIIASAWATETDETVRWLDSIAVEAGAPGDTEPLLVIKQQQLFTGPITPQTKKRKIVFSVGACIALRQLIAKTVTMPKCSYFDGVFDPETVKTGNKPIATEVVKRSMVVEGAYGPLTPSDIVTDLLERGELLHRLKD